MLYLVTFIIFALIDVYQMKGVYTFKINLSIHFIYAFLQVSFYILDDDKIYWDNSDKNILCGCVMFIYVLLRFLQKTNENNELKLFDIYEVFLFSFLPFFSGIWWVLLVGIIIALSYFCAHLNLYKQNEIIKIIAMCIEEVVICIICILCGKDVISICKIVLLFEIVVGVINRTVFSVIDLKYTGKCRCSLDVDW